MERMGSLDAVFIAVEDAVNHMHIGSVGVFEGPAPPFEAVHTLCAAKLQFVVRYRQRVREAPVSIGRPLWIDDVDFDLENHLRHTALPTGDPFGLEQLVGRVMSHPLDRRHPLWEMWLIEGLGDERWALLSKVHHCMVDGIAGSDLLAVIMDLDPDAPLPTPDEWSPAPEPSRLDLARDTGEMTITSIADVVRGGVRALRHPVGTLGRATERGGRCGSHRRSHPSGRFVAHGADRPPPALGPHEGLVRRRQGDPRRVRGHGERRRAHRRDAAGSVICYRRVVNGSTVARSPHSFPCRCGAPTRAGRSIIASLRSTRGSRSVSTTRSRHSAPCGSTWTT